MVPLKAFDFSQIQKVQAKAPSLSIGPQPFIAVAGLTDLERTAGQCDTDRPVLDCLRGPLSSLRWPYGFFQELPFSKSFCMLISACIRFRRRFSSAIAFICDIIDASISQQVMLASPKGKPSILRAPFGKAYPAHAMLAAKLRDRYTALSLPQNTPDLCVPKSSVLHQKSPQISCRESSTL